jgi:hypothetical protein
VLVDALHELDDHRWVPQCGPEQETLSFRPADMGFLMK